ncbi:MAG: hypothetical protein E7454_07230 [Ruminococcaceae bacterium]|nr:hypothetical protein [Oscillospiraceae bacterium]
MRDLHTHILPGMDDGSKTIEESLELLHTLAQQGVDTVALTPHFYRARESAAEFLARREEAWKQLQDATRGQDYPKMILGAEVAWAPGMSEWPDLKKLCYEGTNLIQVELPGIPWVDDVFRQLYSMEGRYGVTPVIAHVDRYFRIQPKRNIEKLIDMGYTMQVSANALLHHFSRKRALELLIDFDAILISDCHNMEERRPAIDLAMNVIGKRYGSRAVNMVVANTDEAFLD